MASADIIDVSDNTFDLEVLIYSADIPVVLDLWAPWCIPCRTQTNVLTKLAYEADGGFRLARINVDAQTNLASKLKVQQLPAVKVVYKERFVAEYAGVLSEQNMRLFIDRIMPKAGNLLLEKGRGLMLLGDPKGAEDALLEYVQGSRGDPAGLFALARAYLWQGKGAEAYKILRGFPSSPEFEAAMSLKPLAEAYARFESLEATKLDPLEAAYYNSLRLARKGRIEMALDGFLDILRQDKHFHNDQLHQIFLALLEVLSDAHPSTRSYRADLSNVLF